MFEGIGGKVRWGGERGQGLLLLEAWPPQIFTPRGWGDVTGRGPALREKRVSLSNIWNASRNPTGALWKSYPLERGKEIFASVYSPGRWDE